MAFNLLPRSGQIICFHLLKMHKHTLIYQSCCHEHLQLFPKVAPKGLWPQFQDEFQCIISNLEDFHAHWSRKGLLVLWDCWPVLHVLLYKGLSLDFRICFLRKLWGPWQNFELVHYGFRGILRTLILSYNVISSFTDKVMVPFRFCW